MGTTTTLEAALVYGQMNEPPGARARVALTGLTVAEYFRDEEGQDLNRLGAFGWTMVNLWCRWYFFLVVEKWTENVLVV